MLASWLTLAALAGSLEISDRTELRLRYPGPLAGEASLDLENHPDAKLTFGSRRTTFVLEYAPQLTTWDVNLVGLHPAYLSTGTAGAEWHDRHLRLALTETGSYGSQNFSSLALTPGPAGSPPPVTLFPAANTFLYEASLTTLEARWRPRRWTITASAAYQLSGGATAVAQRTLPLQQGPLGTVSADFAVTRRDDLATTAAASDASFSTGVDGALVQVDEAWRHAFSRTTTALLRAGVAEAANRGITPEGTPAALAAPVLFEADAVAELSLRHDFTSRTDTGDVTFDGKLGPTINPLIGLVDQRVGATLSGHYDHRPVGLRAQATFSESIPPARLTGVRLFYSEIAASYRVGAAVSIEIGLRTLWQEPSASAATLAGAPANAVYVPVPVLQQVGFVAVTLHADPIRF